MDFYRDLFPEAYVKPRDTIRGHDAILPRPIAEVVRASGENAEGNTSYYAPVYRDLREIREAISNQQEQVGRQALTVPVLYYGRRMDKTVAKYVTAIVLDIDRVPTTGLMYLLRRFEQEEVPSPTYMVTSGGGLHLYYMLDEPIDIYQKEPLQLELREIKRAMLRAVWTENISLKVPDEIKRAGIFQTFRMVGSQTRRGMDRPVNAYRYSDRIQLETLREWYELHCAEDPAADPEESAEQTSATQYAYMDIPYKHTGKRSHNTSAYDSYLNRITDGIRHGIRRRRLVVLASLGNKCGVVREQVLADIEGILPELQAVSQNDPITAEQIAGAIAEGYSWTGRNYTYKHLYNLGGLEIRRQDLSRAVPEWQKEHRTGTQQDCANDLGVSLYAVRQHWSRRIRTRGSRKRGKSRAN